MRNVIAWWKNQRTATKIVTFFIFATLFCCLCSLPLAKITPNKTTTTQFTENVGNKTQSEIDISSQNLHTSTNTITPFKTTKPTNTSGTSVNSSYITSFGYVGLLIDRQDNKADGHTQANRYAEADEHVRTSVNSSYITSFGYVGLLIDRQDNKADGHTQANRYAEADEHVRTSVNSSYITSFGYVGLLHPPPRPMPIFAEGREQITLLLGVSNLANLCSQQPARLRGRGYNLPQVHG